MGCHDICYFWWFEEHIKFIALASGRSSSSECMMDIKKKFLPICSHYFQHIDCVQRRLLLCQFTAIQCYVEYHKNILILIQNGQTMQTNSIKQNTASLTHFSSQNFHKLFGKNIHIIQLLLSWSMVYYVSGIVVIYRKSWKVSSCSMVCHISGIAHSVLLPVSLLEWLSHSYSVSLQPAIQDKRKWLS